MQAAPIAGSHINDSGESVIRTRDLRTTRFSAGRSWPPLNHIQCRDAVLNADGTEAEWPEADVIIGNPRRPPRVRDGRELWRAPVGCCTVLSEPKQLSPARTAATSRRAQRDRRFESAGTESWWLRVSYEPARQRLIFLDALHLVEHRLRDDVWLPLPLR